MGTSGNVIKNSENYLKKNNERLLETYHLPESLKLTKCVKRIGIVDTGIDGKNSYLSSRIWQLSGDLKGSTWHGTAVAGMIAMEVSSHVHLKSYNAFENCQVTSEHALTLVDRAIEDGNQLINVSMNALVDSRSDLGIKLENEWNFVLKKANKANTTIIVSAGNNGINLDNIFPYKLLPAMLDGVITVGAMKEDETAQYSNYGQYVDVWAPGGSMLRPLLTTRDCHSNIDYENEWIERLPVEFMRMYGTSLSTGIVTGLISNKTLGGK